MEESRETAIRFVASQLVFLAAIIHLGIGLVEWLSRIQVGILVPFQFRYVLFVFGGVAVLAGMTVAWQSERERLWYLAGFVTMLAFVFTYFVHHLAGHRTFIFFGQSLAPHGQLSVAFFVEHYFATTVSTITLTVELAAAALLGVLYVDSED